MRIVNRQTFLALPAGTLYMTYVPCAFGPLLIKGDTIYGERITGAETPIDHWEQGLDTIGDSTGSTQDIEILERAQQKGQSFRMDLNCESREGVYDDEQLYAIYEAADVDKLIVRLQEARAAGYSTP